jgi:hypothetical protein
MMAAVAVALQTQVVMLHRQKVVMVVMVRNITSLAQTNATLAAAEAV